MRQFHFIFLSEKNQQKCEEQIQEKQRDDYRCYGTFSNTCANKKRNNPYYA